LPKWFLPTISEVVMLSDPAWATSEAANQAHHKTSSATSAAQQKKAQREWQGAIAALTQLLNQKLATQNAADTPDALIISGPTPILSDAALIPRLSTWVFNANAFNLSAFLPFRSLPGHSSKQAEVVEESTSQTLPLIPGDPLASEQFCLVLSPTFSLVFVLGTGWNDEPVFLFSFLPEVVERTWEILRPRILMLSANHLEPLDRLIHTFAPIAPDYHTVMQFTRRLLEHLPAQREESPAVRIEVPQAESSEIHLDHTDQLSPEELLATAKALDVELLQAIAHEVRTPLTTIRTLTRSLLRRKDLPDSVIQRLQSIDHECSEQIDRFGLIFRAVELETTAAQQTAMSLTRTSVAQVLQQLIPQWQKQANQRGLVLDVVLPPAMPAVVSDPTLLDKALTSLIERFTRNLPAGSHIRVDAALAGDQLKLQLQSQPQSHADDKHVGHGFGRSPLKSLGQMLMFQPETGSLSLNMAVTKNLFQSLGGKLIVRDRPQQGEVMTVYLPLEASSNIIEV